jgi:hypothetical protein
MLAKKVAALASSSIVGGRAPGELGGFILGPAVLRGRREASRGPARTASYCADGEGLCVAGPGGEGVGVGVRAAVGANAVERATVVRPVRPRSKAEAGGRRGRRVSDLGGMDF